MEYATLVGKDFTHCGECKCERCWRNDFISQTAGFGQAPIKDTQQIKASEVVPWDELCERSTAAPWKGLLVNLIVRHVVIPGSKPLTPQGSCGALVFGDIVNGKPPIVENTLKAF
jgi:hypothetical protein